MTRTTPAQPFTKFRDPARINWDDDTPPTTPLNTVVIQKSLFEIRVYHRHDDKVVYAYTYPIRMPHTTAETVLAHEQELHAAESTVEVRFATSWRETVHVRA